MKQPLDVIVVGAGHAGLCASYYLKQSGLKHMVLERGRIGESWVSQRWDSFRMNTADKLNTLPGEEMYQSGPDMFSTAKSLAEGMERFVVSHALPVLTDAKVLSVERNSGSDLFGVNMEHNGFHEQYLCKNVIVASGSQSKKQVCSFQYKLDSEINQFHSSEYRNAAQLSDGDVLIMGSGQSGCQIAEELVQTGRKVYLSTSKVPRCPRRYRGKDIMDWLILSGFFDVRPEEIPDPAMLHIRTPLLKGTGDGRTSLSLQDLAKQGVVLFGKLYEAENYLVSFNSDVQANIAFADAFSVRVKSMIDAFISERNISCPPAEWDQEDEQDLSVNFNKPELSLNLKNQNITNIIWANGFQGEFDYLRLPVFDGMGNIIHRQGIAKIPGLYFLGLHWLRTRKSNILFGIKEDACFITNYLLATLQKK